MRIEDNVYLDFDDVLIKPKRTPLESRKQVNVEREFTLLHSGNYWSGVPIFASNMDTSGTFEMALELSKHKMITSIHKFYTAKEWDSFFENYPENRNARDLEDYIVPSIGLKELNNFRDILKIYEKYNLYPNFVMLDVANGYTERFMNFVKEVRKEFEDITIIAGNVATPEAVEALLFAGADIIKIGIGPSKVCDTRIKTGVGVPQLSAVIECADAAHGLRGHIIADGGCKTPADVSKAFGAGADFVMLGSMLAGHDESGGEIISKWHRGDEVVKDIDGSHLGYLDEEKKFKEVYGMSSEYAMTKHYGKRDEYRASEGNYSLVEYRGPVKNTIEDILGGLRSTCTYTGAENLKGLPRCTTFIRVNRIK